MAASDYAVSTVEYFREARWLHALLAVEVVLLGGGYLLSTFGAAEEQTLLVSYDPLKVAGGLAGSMAIIVGFLILFGFLVALGFRIKYYLEEPAEF